MTLTPSTIRADVFFGNNNKLKCGPGSKPCGNACIPKGHTCRASWNKPVKAVAGATVLAGAAVVGTAFLHPRSGMRSAARAVVDPVVQAGFGANNVVRGNWAGAAKNAANVAMSSQNLAPNLKTLAKGYGTDLSTLYNKGKNAAFKARHHRQAGRKDSVWATGFAP